ncbi:ArsR/SmtB family transcription factor [Nocardioides jishulii]|uniref:Helix-turn-helix transcriptional regulator n=1 Tax=Nocardioides jishulii TaxID=2575440 RepID=A0A4V5TLN0_9ACTN|nr:metalloregulator ArsR/SmtB family transcription factor [Nocardioides jishulii]QCX27676.1 helix-turn-helix transcriptional regulator [Nocardioides jishulii]TKI62483.1 helix-turn-helix transcriptional regulator [Nocardioides jishulii]
MSPHVPLVDSEAIVACCSPVTDGVVTDNAAAALAKMFKALSDPARVKLISLIAASPDGEACICDLTEPVGLSQPTVSHHIKLLVDAGLATREQRGKWAYYRVEGNTLTALASALTQTH